MAKKFVYAKNPISKIYKEVTSNGKGKKHVNSILMGSYVGIRKEENGWYYVATAGRDGWIKKEDTTDDMGLKMFFIDVGQGDATLLEVGNKRILVDGGPNANVRNYLTKWQFSYLLNSNQKVHLDDIYISHFDSDHYAGLIPLIEDERFTIGTIYHNGIARFNSKKSKRPAVYNEDLGTVIKNAGTKYLTTSFDDINSLKNLKQKGGFAKEFGQFADAVLNANRQGRLQKIKRLTHTSRIPGYKTFGKEFTIDVLGPVMSKAGNKNVYEWFKDSSHTRNGHSLVLKIIYGERSFLLGGDLNTRSEEFLLKHYGRRNPFKVDVAKSCHHGASEFLTAFMKKINPFATVISSGDNESYAHPRADAVGCAGRYSRGERPLVFSTELARSINKSGDILYGMINLRCDGKKMIMAQMKEAKKGADIWDDYLV